MNSVTQINHDENARKLAQALIDKGLPDRNLSRPPQRVNIPLKRIEASELHTLIRDVAAKSMQSTKQVSYVADREKQTQFVLINLILSAFAHEHLALGTHIKKDSYLYSHGLTRRGVEQITESLISLGLAKKTRPGFKAAVGSRIKSKSAQYYPTETLINRGVELFYVEVGDFDNYEPYVYSDSKAVHWDEQEDENIRIIRDYNEFMREHTWAFKSPTYRKLDVEKFTGGRLYTPYQTIVNRRVPVRANTLLDGAPIVEVDFQSNHPFLLSYLSGTQLSGSFYDEISRQANVSREQVKEVITKTLGSKKTYSAQNLSQHTKTGVTKQQIERVLNSVMVVHPWFVPHMFANRGLHLQWLEGETTMRMLKFATEKGIPLVNVHDAYATNTQHQEIVSQQMHKFRMEVLEEYKQPMSSLFSSQPP